MKLNEMQNNATGKLPEYGAIFMSNSVTKKECLKQKLFGLSSAHSRFVKHIKVGMILFLFEFERRELHGVFQACSDGGMDIDPHAFSKSGKHYPAQVKFKPIWVCDPLPEREFHDAIKENYFTAKKFSFGLSEVQVRRLLQLFSWKKLGVPERQLAKSRKRKLIVHSMDEAGQIDSRSKVHDGINGKYVSCYNNMDIELRSATTTGYSLLDEGNMEHSRYQFGDVESVPSDGGFLMNDELRNKSNKVNGFELRSSATTEYPLLDTVEQDNSKFLTFGWEKSEYCPGTELHSPISVEYSKSHLRDVKNASSDAGLLMNYDFQNECNKDDGFEPLVVSKYSSLLQSKLGSSSFSRKPFKIADSRVPDQTITKQPSKIHHQMESQLLSNVSSKASYRDAVVMSTHAYDSAVPTVNYQCPLSNEVNFRSTMEGNQPLYGCSENVASSSTKQPFMSYVGRNWMKKSLDKVSPLRNHASFSGPSPSENAYHGTVMGLSQTAHSKNFDVESVKSQFYDGLSSSKFSSADVPSPRTRINGRENKFSSCYPLSPSLYPSMLDAHGYQLESEDQLQLEAARRREIRESVLGNIASAYEDPFTLQGSVSSVDPQSLQHHEHNSFEYDPEHYRSYDAYYSGSRKNRTSVFARLALAPDAYVPERKATVGYNVGDTSMSVDRIMETLHKSHQQWVKLKKPKQGNKKDVVENLRDKKWTSSCEVDVELSKRPAKDINVDCSLAGTDRKVDCSLAGTGPVLQSTEAKLFLNFKRRSEMRKLDNDGTSTFCNTSSRREGVLLGQQKKRKLVRPKFSKNDSPDDKDTKNCSLILQAPVEDISLTNDDTGGCEASIRNQDDKNTVSSLNLKQTDVICQLSQGDGVFDPERRETSGSSCIISVRIGVEVEKESSNNDAGVQSATILGTCEGKNPDILKDAADYCDSTVEGSSGDCGITGDTPVQVLSLGLSKEVAETGNELGANEGERNNKAEMLPSAQSVDGTCVNSSHRAIINKIKSSSNQVSEMQKEGKEHTALFVDTSKENHRQSSLGSATKQSEDPFKKPKSSLEDYCKKRKLKR